MALRSELTAKISADSSGFRSEMGKVGGIAKGTASSVAQSFAGSLGMGLSVSGVVAGLTAAAKATIQYGDSVDKASKRMGFGSEELQRLTYAAKLSGTDVGALETATRTLGNTLMDASRGTKTAIDSLKALGFTYSDLAGKSPERQLQMVMEALADVKDASTRSALAVDMFGRSGTALLPMLMSGADGLRSMREEADRLGAVMGADDVTKMAQLSDAITALTESIKGARNETMLLAAAPMKKIVEEWTALLELRRKLGVMGALGAAFGHLSPAAMLLGMTSPELQETGAAWLTGQKSPGTGLTGMESEADKWGPGGGEKVAGKVAKDWATATQIRENAIRQIKVGIADGDKFALLLREFLDLDTTAATLAQLSRLGGGDVGAGWEILTNKLKRQVEWEDRYAKNLADAAAKRKEIAKELRDNARDVATIEQTARVSLMLKRFFDPIDNPGRGNDMGNTGYRPYGNSAFSGRGGKIGFGYGPLSAGGLDARGLGHGRLGFSGGKLYDFVERSRTRPRPQRETMEQRVMGDIGKIREVLETRLPGGK